MAFPAPFPAVPRSEDRSVVCRVSPPGLQSAADGILPRKVVLQRLDPSPWPIGDASLGQGEVLGKAHLQMARLLRAKTHRESRSMTHPDEAHRLVSPRRTRRSLTNTELLRFANRHPLGRRSVPTRAGRLLLGHTPVGSAGRGRQVGSRRTSPLGHTHSGVGAERIPCSTLRVEHGQCMARSKGTSGP